jgi:hypothetical protein
LTVLFSDSVRSTRSDSRALRRRSSSAGSINGTPPRVGSCSLAEQTGRNRNGAGSPFRNPEAPLSRPRSLPSLSRARANGPARSTEQVSRAMVIMVRSFARNPKTKPLSRALSTADPIAAAPPSAPGDQLELTLDDARSATANYAVSRLRSDFRAFRCSSTLGRGRRTAASARDVPAPLGLGRRLLPTPRPPLLGQPALPFTR